MKLNSANINVMVKACRKASKILIRDFGEIEKLQVSIKGPSDFVTNADIAAEKIIIKELTKARPNYSIISEESGYINKKDKENTWIIDPIDGTTNFLHGIPHFAISIALKSKNEIVLGLPVAALATLSATSIASEPPVVKRTLDKLPGEISQSFLARLTAGSHEKRRGAKGK